MPGKLTGRNPTRADVAERAETSLATVSYVVNNGPKFVSEKTRQRVLQAIAELGYRPDPVALSFRGLDSSAVGMLVPNFGGPFFADLVSEVERQAAQRGKVVLFGSTGYDPAAEQAMLQTFRDRRVGAALVIGPTPSIGPASVEHGALNVIRFGSSQEVVPVGISQRAATRAAAEHLLGHGAERMAAIFGPTAHEVFNVRYRGWRDATGYSPEQNKQLVRRAVYSFQGGYDTTIELFCQPKVPDALYVSNDTQAIGALSALHRLGMAVPGDVPVASIDSTELSFVQTVDAIKQLIDRKIEQLSLTG